MRVLAQAYRLYRRIRESQVAMVAGLAAVLALGSYVLSFASATPPVPPAPRIVATEAPLTHRVQSAAASLPVDCAKVACMALTFDDGPNPAVTPQVLDILDRHHARATFFLIGLHVPGNEALVRRIHQSGHEIGNHTWGHPDLNKLSPAEVEDQIAHAQEIITAAGVPAPHLFRPPYGEADTVVRSHTPLSVVMWNIDPEDWRAKKPEDIVAHVLAHAKPGGIVDMHDIKQVTADALDPILSGLEQQYHLVTISELLSLPPGQLGVFYGR